MDFKEFHGSIGASNKVGVVVQEGEKFVDENGNEFEGEGLIVEIEAIHETITSNFTRYKTKAMKEGLLSWTQPYNKPVIEHHDEEKGSVIGRVLKAEFRESGEAGLPCVVVTALITDEEAIKKIEDGRLLTTSIGARADNVRCSICDHHIVSEKIGCPKHARGSRYGGELCVWDINDMYIKEISYVVVPSDKFSKNTRILKKSSVKSGTFLESAISNGKGGSSPMKDDTNTSVNTTEADKGIPQTSVELTESEKLAKSENTIIELRESYEQSEALRQEAEARIVANETELRTVLMQSIEAVSYALGKGPIDTAKLSGRVIESLKDKLADDLEELKLLKEGKAEEVTPEPTGTTTEEIPVTDHGKVATSESAKGAENPEQKEVTPDKVDTTVQTTEAATDIPKAQNPATIEDEEKIIAPTNLELQEKLSKIFG